MQPLKTNKCPLRRVFQLHYYRLVDRRLTSVLMNQIESSKVIYPLNATESYEFKLQTCLGNCREYTESSPYIHVTLIPGTCMLVLYLKKLYVPGTSSSEYWYSPLILLVHVMETRNMKSSISFQRM